MHTIKCLFVRIDLSVIYSVAWLLFINDFWYSSNFAFYSIHSPFYLRAAVVEKKQFIKFKRKIHMFNLNSKRVTFHSAF